MMIPGPAQSPEDPRTSEEYAMDMRDSYARAFARAASVGGADEHDARFMLKQFILWEAQVKVTTR